MGETLLSIQDLSKYYTSPQNVVKGIDQISLSFALGEFVAITGQSGSGKSTLAHVLGGILPYEGGELFYRGKPTSHYDTAQWELYRRDCVSFISQDYGILPGSTVLDNVVCALRLAGFQPRQAREEAGRILHQVELWPLRRRRAAKLSSGQKQRLAIARALAKPAPVLIADEPTGNLDQDNSEKVLRLLSQAARTRLVILITHEFDQAEPYVTRHIVLQDGRVTQDARLDRPALAPEQPSHRCRLPRRGALSAYVSRLQLRARPVWSCLMLAFFALTLFGVFALAGTFLSQLDDTATRMYDNSAFQNGDDRRIVVCRPDGAPLTAQDEQALLALPFAASLERYSYLADIAYAYREGVDYTWQYTLDNVGSSVDQVYDQVSAVTLVPQQMDFARTIPLLPQGKTFLAQGRLPEHIGQAVSADPALLGQTIPVYFRDGKNWNSRSTLCLEVEIVGVAASGSGLYFHEDLGRVFQGEVELYAASQGGSVNGFFFLPNDQLAPGQALMEQKMYDLYRNRGADLSSFPLQSVSGEEGQVVVSVTGFHSSTASQLIEVDPDTFRTLTSGQEDAQFSLWIDDYAYTDRVLDRLYELGYAALSPYREGSIFVDPGLAQARTQTLRLCLIALLVLVALQVVVFRAMFSMELDSYRVLRHIGLTCTPARLSVLWQVLALVLAGQVLGLLAIAGCGWLGVESIARLLRWLPIPLRALLCALHLAAGLATAAWSMSALRRQLYPVGGAAPDLDWTALEEEVAA